MNIKVNGAFDYLYHFIGEQKKSITDFVQQDKSIMECGMFLQKISQNLDEISDELRKLQSVIIPLREHHIVEINEGEKKIDTINCPNCGQRWNIEKYNSCECGATIKCK